MAFIESDIFSHIPEVQCVIGVSACDAHLIFQLSGITMFYKYLLLNWSRSLHILLVELLVAVVLAALLAGWLVLLGPNLMNVFAMGCIVILGIVHFSLPVIVVIESFRLHKVGKEKESYTNLMTLVPYCVLIAFYIELFKYAMMYWFFLVLMIGTGLSEHA